MIGAWLTTSQRNGVGKMNRFAGDENGGYRTILVRNITIHVHILACFTWSMA